MAVTSVDCHEVTNDNTAAVAAALASLPQPSNRAAPLDVDDTIADMPDGLHWC